jgi:membrane-bound lytic murein transglycosylase D
VQRAKAQVQLVKATNSNRVKVSYSVKPGDTLGSIARRFKTTIPSLKTWNNLAGNRIAAGKRLTVYPPSVARIN